MLYCKTMGQGPNLVLLHGFAFQHEVWRELLASLQQRYTVHLIDLPGHGLSQQVEMPVKIEDCISMLMQVLPQSAHFVGWSLGGLLASKIALIDFKRVQSLSLVGSTPCFLETKNWHGVSLDFFETFKQKIIENPEKALRYFTLLGLAERPLQKNYFNVVFEILKKNSLPTTNTLLNALEILAHTDLRDSIAQLQCPFRYFMGESDPLTPLNSLPQQKILPIPGHFPLLTNPKILLDELREFVNECDSVRV